MMNDRARRAAEKVERIKAQIDGLSFDAPRWVWDQKLEELEDAELVARILAGANWAA